MGGTAEEETTEEVVEETVVETLDSPAVTTARTYGDGFTSEPCPEAIGDYPTLQTSQKDVFTLVY